MPDISKIQPNLNQQLPVSHYEGKQAFRTALDRCGYAKRVVLLFVAVLFSCGFALLNSRVQKIRHELMEGKKITFLSKEQVEARKDAAKTAGLGKENLVKKEAEKQNQAIIVPQKPIVNKPTDKLPEPSTPKQDKIEVDEKPRAVNLEPLKVDTDKKLTIEDIQDLIKVNADKEFAKEDIQALINFFKLPDPPLRKVERLVKDQIDFHSVAPHFAKIASNQLLDLNGLTAREDFLESAKEKTFPIKPIVLAKSKFINAHMLKHLMQDKQPSKLGIKYKPGDFLTNMEGALHTFLTPITPIVMSGDYIYKGGHGIQSLNGKGRNVVLSAAIHPDFELGGENEVVMKIVEIKEDSLEGERLYKHHLPLHTRITTNAMGGPTFAQELPKYEEDLRRYMVYHLTKEHRLPSLKELPADSIKKPQEALALIEILIK